MPKAVIERGRLDNMDGVECTPWMTQKLKVRGALSDFVTRKVVVCDKKDAYYLLFSLVLSIFL
jgi:hypothetical protein